MASRNMREKIGGPFSRLSCRMSTTRTTEARAIRDRWQETGSCRKVLRDEGESAFSVAARLTEMSPWPRSCDGRDVRVEQPAEVLAKKIKYRGSRFAPRDVFDLIAIHRHDPSIVSVAVAAAPEALRRTADRIERTAGRYRATIADEVNPTSSGAQLLEVDPLDAVDILAGA